MKKKMIISTLLSMMITFSLPTFVSASQDTVASITCTDNTTQAITPRIEETQWYVFTINGRPYKRLWSITRKIWLTDPIPIV